MYRPLTIDRCHQSLHHVPYDKFSTKLNTLIHEYIHGWAVVHGVAKKKVKVVILIQHLCFNGLRTSKRMK
jgi:hypothetical protein